MRLEFIDPTVEIALYQRAQSLERMTEVLSEEVQNFRDRSAVIKALIKADFDPKLISGYWQEAAKLAALGKRASRFPTHVDLRPFLEMKGGE